MFDTTRSIPIDIERQPITHFIKKCLKCLCALLLLTTVLAAAENNWLGYAWRSAQLAVHGDDGKYGIGNSPESVMDAAAVNADGATTILAVGDIVSCPAPQGIKRNLSTLASWVGLSDPLDPSQVAATDTVDLLQHWPNAPILALGDIVYRRGTPQEYADCFDPIWGAVSERTLPAPGNHEYYTPAAYAYFDYWGQQAGPDRRGYYAVQSNNWLILSLNTEIDADPASPQGQWLTETLAASTEQCILAYYHRPAYSGQTRSGGGSEHVLFEQLVSAGADVVLNGHNHVYERTHPMNSAGDLVDDGGTVSFVVGTGGRAPTGANAIKPADFTAKTVSDAQGVLRLDLRGDNYDWAFHSVDGAAVLDQGTRGCNAN